MATIKMQFNLKLTGIKDDAGTKKRCMAALLIAIWNRVVSKSAAIQISLHQFLKNTYNITMNTKFESKRQKQEKGLLFQRSKEA